MCTCKVAVLLALVGCAYAEYLSGEITQRAADRQRYETELKVSCDTGDDRACFEFFLSYNRMYIAIAGGILAFIILVSFCVCCCCCCKRKYGKVSTRNKRFNRPGLDAVVVSTPSRSSQSLLPHKAP